MKEKKPVSKLVSKWFSIKTFYFHTLQNFLLNNNTEQRHIFIQDGSGTRNTWPEKKESFGRSRACSEAEEIAPGFHSV